MLSKKFTLSNGEEVEAKELTVGNMKGIKKLLETDEMGATFMMVQKSLGVDESFVDDMYMSDMKLVSDWLVDPSAD